MEENLKYWIAFNLVFAEDLNSAQKVFQRFPTVQDVFRAKEKDFKGLNLKAEHIERLRSSTILDRACRELDRLNKKGYTVLTIEDEKYPEYLREIFDPPRVLYCVGNLNVLREPAVSIVGARKSSPYGRAVAEKLAYELASRGLVIVSGMASGIDSVAHWGALKGGQTVAVLGSGLDCIYPRENRRLFRKIIESGLVMTEYGLKTKPLGFHFPLRNRIISGLSLAVIVAEAAERSGSLISAKLALEQNREVMAVPGNITSPLSKGTNWLLKNGAKLIETWEDVVEELPPRIAENMFSEAKTSEQQKAEMSPVEKDIVKNLSEDSLTHIDMIVKKTGLSVSEVLSFLLKLELKGIVTQSPGKYFQRKL
ncbi:MAG: DNA-protecting protein DprA [Candidatus Aminicenantes bacterium]|nr:DNA-protecting protein DprA [Candidatus Aminicenantes bacterium]